MTLTYGLPFQSCVQIASEKPASESDLPYSTLGMTNERLMEDILSTFFTQLAHAVHERGS